MTTELWTEEELVAAVIGYRIMQILEEEGKSYSKATIYSTLEKLHPRTAKAFRRRMHNISSVLQGNDEEWIAALQPLSHIGSQTQTKIATILRYFNKPNIDLVLKLYDTGFYRTDL